MNSTQLIKKLLPGLIPLFVFIVADEIWGTQIGLLVALGIGIAEMIWIRIKEKRFDRMVLIDTGLLVALGSISIIFDNDIFFKLKPGLIEIILCAVLGISGFSKFNLIGLMTSRYMKGVSLDEQQVMQFRKMLQRMFLIFLIHTLLVFYSAFFMSNKAWAFISGGMFYLLFIAIVGYEFLNRKIKQKKEATVEPEEWLPLVDEKGTDIGRAPRSACHQGEKLLHPVVHLHVLNQHKHIFLQKRPLNKLIQPGKWDTAVGGHISLGETLETALKREAYEEIGLKNFSAKLVKTYKWETEIETELVYVFVTYNYQTIHLHSPEVEEGKFWTPHQILHETGNQTFTPNFEYEYQLLKNLYFK